jgi:hypothetical protein
VRGACRSLEEALVHAFVEARRAAPAILFLPHLQLWWQTAPASLRAALWMLLADLPPELPLLLLATADVPVVRAARLPACSCLAVVCLLARLEPASCCCKYQLHTCHPQLTSITAQGVTMLCWERNIIAAGGSGRRGG